MSRNFSGPSSSLKLKEIGTGRLEVQAWSRGVGLPLGGRRSQRDHATGKAANLLSGGMRPPAHTLAEPCARTASNAGAAGMAARLDGERVVVGPVGRASRREFLI
jgi:hypothetical protein